MPSKQKNTKQTAIYRKLGFLLSTACLIHCLLLPVVLIFSPMIGHQFHMSFFSEMMIYSLAFVFGITSLKRDFNRHKNTLPIILFIAGFVAILLSHLVTVQAIIILTLIVGSICLIGGQMINFKLHRKFH